MREHHPLKLQKNTIRKLLKADDKKGISSQVMLHLKDQYVSQKALIDRIFKKYDYLQ